MSPWWELCLSVPSELAEEVGALLWDAGALGVEEHSHSHPPPALKDSPLIALPEPGRSVLLASFDGEWDEAAVTESAEDSLAQLGLVPMGVSLRRRDDTAWAERWKQFFKPLRAGERLWVVPSWEKDFVTPAGAVVVTLDPGLAFGTGQHATTALCMQVLAGESLAGRSVIDVGCGSGILAIAAHKLGAKPVVATDNDPVAVDVTRENLTINDVAGVDVSTTDLKDVPGRFDYVVANIIAPVLIELAEPLVGHVTSGGTLLLSGVLAFQEDEVTAAMRQAAKALGKTLSHRETRRDGEWVAIVLSC